jgi:transcriptional regulator with XRE-family HTH domain
MKKTAHLRLQGPRFHKLRKVKGRSAEKLARRAGIAIHSLWRFGANERPKARDTTIAQVAQALDTSLEYLLGWPPGPHPLEAKAEQAA